MTESLLVLDTNICLYYLGGRLVDPLPLGQYFVSIITEMELLSYPHLSTDEEKQIHIFLNHLIVIGIENEIKQLAISFRKNYKIKLPDAVIAATARFLDATLLTNDQKLTNLTEIKTQSLAII